MCAIIQDIVSLQYNNASEIKCKRDWISLSPVLLSFFFCQLKIKERPTFKRRRLACTVLSRPGYLVDKTKERQKEKEFFRQFTVQVFSFYPIYSRKEEDEGSSPPSTLFCIRCNLNFRSNLLLLEEWDFPVCLPQDTVEFHFPEEFEFEKCEQVHADVCLLIFRTCLPDLEL